ncbi:UPF0687 protein C20orf27 homolog isoform X2 [Amphibalanus amphitrite]|uniref:UPF0687 protein C20orf27 homolog isoform X2 n=1 Tax=Amphibalanus amphitrite TaxID=1232801 RepID=UPI001C8FF392|nr:UPF0687 protein C20orf27 homolog isoform X2 [Amphibalanus amphitrite]
MLPIRMEVSEPTNHAAAAAERAEHHVHFSETGEDGDQLEPVHKVDVCVEEDKIAIHAGFLKALHQYRVTCRVPVRCHGWTPTDIPSLHWRVQTTHELPDGGTELTLHVVARKEKLLKEKLVLTAPDGSDSVTLELNARVLGKNTGTPFLRDGVHLEGVIKDDDASESSDWRGFD